MIRIRLYNMQTGEMVNTLDLPMNPGKKGFNVFDVVTSLEAMQETEDIFRIGRTGSGDLKARSISTKNGVSTNIPDKNADVVEGRNSAVLGPSAGSSMREMENFELDGEDIGYPIGFKFYEPGFVLATGKRSYNIFGIGSDAYLRTIGSSRIYSVTKSGAKVFKDLASLEKYIQKHIRTFKYCVSEHSYNWSLDFSCDLAAEDYRERLTGLKGKTLEREKKHEDAVNELLNEANMQEADTAEADDIPESTDEAGMQQEALKRMEKLDLWENVIKGFEKGELFQSEAGGIIYTLDADAKKAVDRVRKDDLLPYHVVKTGNLYSVLYVSPRPEEWAMERADRDGILMSYCYNADEELFSEYGSAQFNSANGGLVRTA